MIAKGFITEITEGGKRAKVSTFQGQTLSDVLLLHPYGESSNPPIDDNSLVLLLYGLGSKSNIFAIPYNVDLQPALEGGEKAVGNFFKGNKITFKANGDIEILTDADINSICENFNIDATKLTLTGDADINGNTLINGNLTVNDFIDSLTSYKIDGIKVIGNQGVAIPNPVGGGPNDAVCRATVVLILNAMRLHGLIA